MKYTKICSDKPIIIKQNPDYYIDHLQHLIDDVDLQLYNAFIFLKNICNVEAKLSTKSMGIFWKFIQRIVDWLYDKVLYCIEELDSYRIAFVKLKLRAEQVKIFS